MRTESKVHRRIKSVSPSHRVWLDLPCRSEVDSQPGLAADLGSTHLRNREASPSIGQVIVVFTSVFPHGIARSYGILNEAREKEAGAASSVTVPVNDAYHNSY